MDFLVYSRSARASGAAEDDPQLDERHWSYMDTFVDGMTARGPTLGADRQTWTGSLHVVDLAGPKVVREFVDREPYNQAGLFEEHVIWRFENLLGKTMWQFSDTAHEPRFLVFAQAADHRLPNSRLVPLADLAPQLRQRLIVYGALRDLDDGRLEGVAIAVQAPTRTVLDALLGDGLAELANYCDVEIHDWEFGGRR